MNEAFDEMCTAFIFCLMMNGDQPIELYHDPRPGSDPQEKYHVRILDTPIERVYKAISLRAALEKAVNDSAAIRKELDSINGQVDPNGEDHSG